MKLDLSAPAIAARLRQASERTDLHPDRRLQAKLDLTAAGIARRIEGERPDAGAVPVAGRPGAAGRELTTRRGRELIGCDPSASPPAPGVDPAARRAGGRHGARGQAPL